jgi:hypothetical protein
MDSAGLTSLGVVGSDHPGTEPHRRRVSSIPPQANYRGVKLVFNKSVQR